MSTKVTVYPGPCGSELEAIATKTGRRTVHLKVTTKCAAITKMFEELGEDFNSFELCLQKPGTGPFFTYAQEHFPVHVSCPALAGIIKAVEAECGLALKRDCYIRFEDI